MRHDFSGIGHAKCPGCRQSKANGTYYCSGPGPKCRHPGRGPAPFPSEREAMKRDQERSATRAMAEEVQRRAHELGMMSGPPPSDAPDGFTDHPIVLSRVDQAVVENLLDADRHGELAAQDMVHLPAHYARFKVEPISFIVENGLNWFQGNIVKYASRAEHKHATPQEDISKIIRYAEMWKKHAAGDENWWR